MRGILLTNLLTVLLYNAWRLTQTPILITLKMWPTMWPTIPLAFLIIVSPSPAPSLIIGFPSSTHLWSSFPHHRLLLIVSPSLTHLWSSFPHHPPIFDHCFPITYFWFSSPTSCTTMAQLSSINRNAPLPTRLNSLEAYAKAIGFDSLGDAFQTHLNCNNVHSERTLATWFNDGGFMGIVRASMELSRLANLSNNKELCGLLLSIVKEAIQHEMSKICKWLSKPLATY